MIDPDRVLTPDMLNRVDAALRTGINPFDYFVGSERLRVVIQVAKANADVKQKLLAYLEEHLIKGQPEVGCAVLGMAMYEFASITPDEDVMILINDVRDLDKLPYSRIGSEPVN